jgi:hypothetical protein
MRPFVGNPDSVDSCDRLSSGEEATEVCSRAQVFQMGGNAAGLSTQRVYLRSAIRPLRQEPELRCHGASGGGDEGSGVRFERRHVHVAHVLALAGEEAVRYSPRVEPDAGSRLQT